MVLNWSDETKQGHPPTSHCFENCQWFSCIKLRSRLSNLGTLTSEMSPPQESCIEQVCRFHGVDPCSLGGTSRNITSPVNLVCPGVMTASLSMNFVTGNSSKQWGTVPESPLRIWVNHSIKKEISLVLLESFLSLILPPLVVWIPVICPFCMPLIKFKQMHLLKKGGKKMTWGQMNHPLKSVIATGKVLTAVPVGESRLQN